jgi:superfamily I DNA/RNA helicase
VLAAIDPSLMPPRSVRSTGVAPRAVAAERGALDDTVAKLVAEEAGAVGEGRVAVLAPTALVAGLRERLLGEAVAEAEADLEAPVVVLPVAKAKGLEFDAVVVVEPAEIIAESPRGTNDLYVAITRSTQRLAVAHTDPLPQALRALGEDRSAG